MRMRKKPNLRQRIERCACLLETEPEQLRGKWQQTFGYAGIHLEIGCGKGRFIAAAAQYFPDILFIALEKTANVIVSALEQAAREGLKNIRFINSYAENLPDYFAPGEISRIYINFCDPWPSNRHIKRRLTGRGYLEIYKDILCGSGELHIKTDTPELYNFTLRELEICGFVLTDKSTNLHEHGVAGIITEYEQKFYDCGRPIFWCKAIKGAAGETD